MKTMLDKCAVAGDITQAIDRRGAWSCAVTVIGGAENTAVKLQSADSADGTFEDFKTLIPSTEASASQYKGFVVDISGAGNFIKVVGATMATCVLGDCDVDVKKVAIKAGEIPSGADLEDNKTATIDVSTYTEPVEIEPTEGKDGMKKATVTLSNIPSGGTSKLFAYGGMLVNGYITRDVAYHTQEFTESDIGTTVTGIYSSEHERSCSISVKQFTVDWTYQEITPEGSEDPVTLGWYHSEDRQTWELATEHVPDTETYAYAVRVTGLTSDETMLPRNPVCDIDMPSVS